LRKRNPRRYKMKFPVDKCLDCGLDLTTAEPAEVRNFDNRMATGTCPGCGRTYFMTEVVPSAPPLPVSEPVVEPEAEVGEPEAPETEAEAEPEPDTPPEPEAPEPAPEPEPET